MEKLSRILGLHLLLIREGQDCGSICELVVDPDEKRVAYLMVDTGSGSFGMKVLPVEDINGMGNDFTTSASGDHVSRLLDTPSALELAYSSSDIINSKIVSSNGDIIGEVEDFEFDPKNGEINLIIMRDGTVLERRCLLTFSRGFVFVDNDAMHGSAPSLKFDTPKPAPEPAPPKAAPAPAPKAAPAPAAAPPKAAPAPAAAPPKAAPAPAPAPKATGAAPEKRSNENYFDRRRSEYLIGRTVNKDIIAADGTMLAAKGDVVSSEMVDAIKAADKIIELTMGVD